MTRRSDIIKIFAIAALLGIAFYDLYPPASARLDKQKSRMCRAERRICVGNVHYRQHPLNELIIKTGGRLPCATCMWLAAIVHSLKI